MTNDQTNVPNSSGSEAIDSGHSSPVQQTELRLRPESRIFGQSDDSAVGNEQYRLLQGRLFHLQSAMKLKRLLVTSAGRAEGKTHVCANLGITMARETDRRILLIDADMRKPDLHRVYGIPNEYGLTDVLRNGHDMWKAIRKVWGMNLYIMTTGTSITQPLAMSSILTLKALLDQMNSVFDWVIIDSPPVLVAADTPLLAKLADGVLFVVGASGTPRDLVVRAKDMLEGVPVIGAVLNRINPISAQYARHYHGAYGPPSAAKNGDKSGNTPRQPGRILT